MIVERSAVKLEKVHEERTKAALMPHMAAGGVNWVLLQERNHQQRRGEATKAASIWLVNVTLLQEVLDKEDEGARFRELP